MKLERNGFMFDIDNKILSKYIDLIELILETESIETNEEKQEWFDKLKTMEKKDIDKFYNILKTEKDKLELLEIEYIVDKTNLKKKEKFTDDDL